MEKPLPRTVRTLGWVSFWADVASESVYPVIPLFVRGVLKAPMSVLGASEGLATVVVSLMRAWSGWHSDQSGSRMPYVRTGYGLSGVAKPLLALAFAWPTVLAARVLDRFGKGLRSTALDALIADSIDPSDAGRAFGYHRAMDSAGAFVGAAIGCAMLFLLPGQYRLIFALAGIPGLIAMGITFRVKEPAPQSDEAPVTKKSIETTPEFRRALVPVVLFGLANSSDAFLIQGAKETGISDGMVAMSYILYNATYASMSYPLGRLSDRVGRKPLLAFGWIIYAVAYSGFAYLGAGGPGALLWPLMLLYGVHLAATDGVSKALVADVSGKERRGTLMGLYYLITGFAALVASLVGGALWDRYGRAATFEFGAIMALLALAAIGFLPATKNAT